MQWRMGRRSDNVEDRRGMGVPMGVAGGGIGTIILVLAALFFGFDPSVILQGGTRSTGRAGTRARAEQGRQRAAQVRLGGAGRHRGRLARPLPQRNAEYREPKLVLFTGAVQSACGFAQAAVGPFYCPGDQQGLPRPLVLPRPARPLRRSRRFRPGVRHRPRGRPPRAEPARHLRPGAAPRSSARGSGRPTRSPCGSSCRPTASPACGRTTPSRRGKSSRRATWRRR